LGVLRSAKIRQAFDNISLKDKRASRFGYSLSAFLLIGFWTVVSGAVPMRGASGFPKSYPQEMSVALGELYQGEGAVFHSPDWGGYLTWTLWPRVKPLFDDRNELNGEEKYKDFLLADRLMGKWEDVFEKYEIKYALLNANSPLAAVLAQEASWQLVKADKVAVLYRKL
jgi:hypothetical protein